jgi:hypothetical protein
MHLPINLSNGERRASVRVCRCRSPVLVAAPWDIEGRHGIRADSDRKQGSE